MQKEKDMAIPVMETSMHASKQLTESEITSVFEKMIEDMANTTKEELTSEEFERRYPRKHTPYELQRLKARMERSSEE